MPLHENVLKGHYDNKCDAGDKTHRCIRYQSPTSEWLAFDLKVHMVMFVMPPSKFFLGNLNMRFQIRSRFRPIEERLQHRIEDDPPDIDPSFLRFDVQGLDVGGHGFEIDGQGFKLPLCVEFDAIPVFVERACRQGDRGSIFIDNGHHEIDRKSILMSFMGFEPPSRGPSGLSIDKNFIGMGLVKDGVGAGHNLVHLAVNIGAPGTM